MLNTVRGPQYMEDRWSAVGNPCILLRMLEHQDSNKEGSLRTAVLQLQPQVLARMSRSRFASRYISE